MKLLWIADHSYYGFDDRDVNYVSLFKSRDFWKWTVSVCIR